MQTEDTGREGENGEEGHLERGCRRKGRRWMGLREMPIPPSLKGRTKVLKVLVLRSNHPSELIMPLLDKLPKSGMLRSNISLKGGLLFLNGPKCGFNVRVGSRGWLGRGTRSSNKGRRHMWGKRSQYFIITRQI